MRSGTMVCSAPCSRATPSMVRRSLPIPAMRAHRVEAVGEVGDLRLARGVGEDGAAFGEAGRHQQVLRRADRDEGKHDGGAAQPAGDAAVDIAGVEAEAGAHLLQPLEVQIDGAGADGAASRHGDARLAHARQQRTEHEDRRAHLAHDVVGRLGAGDGAAERQRAPVIADGFHRDAVLGEEGAHGLDVGEPRHVGENEALVGEQAGGHQRQRGILGAADGDLAGERPAAADADTVHGGLPTGEGVERLARRQGFTQRTPRMHREPPRRNKRASREAPYSSSVALGRPRCSRCGTLLLHSLGSATPRWRMYLPALSA